MLKYCRETYNETIDFFRSFWFDFTSLFMSDEQKQERYKRSRDKWRKQNPNISYK